MVRWSLSAEFFALLLLVILIIFVYQGKQRPTLQRKLYAAGLWLAISSILLNMVCVYTVAHAQALPLWVNLALNSLYFTLCVLMCTVIGLYLFRLVLAHVYDRSCMRKATAALSALFLGFVALVIWNLRSGVLFYFDDRRAYHRGPLNWVCYAVMGLEILLLLVCYLRNRPSVSRFTTHMIFLLLPAAVLLGILQLLVPELLLNGTIIAVAQLIIFLSSQTRHMETDSLTDAGNRNGFYHELELRLAGKQHFQAVVMTLDNFSSVNQRFGHDTGNMFLYEVAHWLETQEKPAQVFRTANVEFALLLPAPLEERQLVEHLRRRFSQPWQVGKAEAILDARIISLTYRGQPWNASAVLECLDYTLDLSKRENRRELYFDQRVAEELNRRTALLERLHRAIREQAFQVWYQPVYTCAGSCFDGAEALLRLQDDDGTFIPPSTFIPLAEKTDLIGQLGWIVLEDICRLLSEPGADGLTGVSMNLSMQQFLDPELVPRITGYLERWGVSPRRLKIEITERVLLQDLERARRLMEELSALGIGFYLDDFGTGYSNLATLLALPFECVKLDRSLLDAFPQRSPAQILQPLAALFRNLDKQVVAEGVESRDQALAAARCGVDRIQGYYYAKPMPRRELTAFLARKASQNPAS